MMIAVWIAIGLATGFAVRWLIDEAARKLRESELQQARREGEAAAGRVRVLEEANVALGEERAELRGRFASQQALLDAAEHRVEEVKAAAEKQIAEVRDAADKQVAEVRDAAYKQVAEVKNAAEQRIMQMRQETDNLRKESEAQWQLKFDKLREEIKTLTEGALAAKQSSLQETNRTQIDELLRPVKEQFELFRKAVDESRTSGEVAKRELKSSFEATMKLFEQQQKLTVEELRRETSRIGEDAANLTRALKRDSKAQGDWGEMILDTLLESSGLERDVHYFIQENVKDEEGNNRRPDVVVRFPEGRAVVIDSKVSLTAYVEAFETDDETTRVRKLKEHARSVRRHIDELADKKYDKLVEDSVSFVLMFIPNDQCYLSAMEQDKSMGSYAYSRGVVIISPSNLMIALQLSYNMWQRDRQNKNIEEIVREATAIYEKAATFTETFLKAENQLATVVKTFTQGRSQLFDGNGNFLRRLEALKSRGITPKKSIKGLKGADEEPREITTNPLEDNSKGDGVATGEEASANGRPEGEDD